MKFGKPSIKGKLPKNFSLFSARAVKFKKGSIPWNKGIKYDKNTEALQKWIKEHGAWNKGKKLHYQVWNKGIKNDKIVGEKHWNWKKDRGSLANKQERNDSAYQDWRKQVWLRDNFKCKIANPDCCGKIEAHHILGWKDYPELHYQTNNGITLCHAHHPRKRAEEKRLIPTFQELVSVSS